MVREITERISLIGTFVQYDHSLLSLHIMFAYSLLLNKLNLPYFFK